MPDLNTPTTKEVSDSIIAELQSTLNQTIPLLPKAFLRVLSKVLGGVFILLYKYGGSISLNTFVQYASSKETTINGITLIPLVELGRELGVTDPTPATNAEFTVEITVTNQVGSLPSGTQLASSANGVTYLTIGSVALSAATVTATIRAASDQSGGDGSGSVGNLDVGAVVSFVNPLANVERDAVILTQDVTGSDAEDIDTVYRQRVLDRKQKLPQGGAYADYEQWSEEVAGIINAYPYTGDPGNVLVYCEATVESSGDPDGIPTQAQLDAVADSIELDEAGLATRRPAGALVSVLAITRTPFVVDVAGLSVSGLSEVQAQIETAIEEYFLAREPYILGLTTPPRKDQINRSAVAGVVFDIVSSAGGTFTTVTMTVFGNQLESYFLGEGEKAKGSATFS